MSEIIFMPDNFKSKYQSNKKQIKNNKFSNGKLENYQIDEVYMYLIFAVIRWYKFDIECYNEIIPLYILAIHYTVKC